MNILKASAAALGVTTLLATPIYAQSANPTVNANNLVSVTLSESLIENVANDLDVNVSQIPVTVEVPIGVAANVCNVAANVLASNNKSNGANCDAETTSQALNQAIQKQISSQ